MVYLYNVILFSHEKKGNPAICSNMDRPRDCLTEWSNSDRGREISYDIPYMWNLKRNDANEHIYKTETYRLREPTYGYQGGSVGGNDS